jgi:microcystin-dependent protein
LHCPGRHFSIKELEGGQNDMADAYLGEIRIFAGNFAPNGWALCNGALLPIAQNTALFSILGTQYGGNGQTNFALPNLSGSAAMSQGSGQGLTARAVGESVGTQSVTLDTNEMPAHNHVPNAVTSVAADTSPANDFWAVAPAEGKPPHHVTPNLYTSTVNAPMSPVALSVTGGSQPHNNMQPYLAMNFIICMNGEYPQRP